MKRMLAAVFMLSAMPAGACKRSDPVGTVGSHQKQSGSEDGVGDMDSTKLYYDDSEAPAFQIQVTNRVEKRVPWAEVPEKNRYILEYHDPPRDKPRVRMPIVKVVMNAVDEDGKPASPDDAYFYEYTEFGLNPAYKRRGVGGSKH